MRCERAAILFAAVVLGCGDGAAPDGGVDGGDSGARDTGPDVGRDVGPHCPEECELGMICCGADGGAHCVDPLTDPRNCGECGTVCAEGRGTECVEGMCRCGRDERGCAGTVRSTCCPPREDGGTRYCANFLEDGDDCGSCGNSCDPATSDRCLGGRCVCGEEARAGCEGTPEDTCCSDGFRSASCVDTLADRNHCGDCLVSCRPGEDCIDGVCTIGDETCAGGCTDGRICCDGVCCARLACDDGACRMDAGLPDGGLRDGGADGAVMDAMPDDGAAADASRDASDTGPSSGG